MKNKEKKRYVIVPQKIYPNQINELALCCFIVRKDMLDDIHEFVVRNGGRIISAIPSQGISRSTIFNAISGEAFETYFILSTCQQEVADVFMLNACREFEFNKKGMGKAFVVDILGYMGAKGLFVE